MYNNPNTDQTARDKLTIKHLLLLYGENAVNLQCFFSPLRLLRVFLEVSLGTLAQLLLLSEWQQMREGGDSKTITVKRV